MNLKWRRVKSQDNYVNSVINIKHRHDFAIEMVNILEEGKTLINFDESVINATTSQCYSWVNKAHNIGRAYKKVVSGMSILLAVTSSGEIYFQFLDGNNNANSVALFLVLLSEELDFNHPEWREDHILLLDNCPSHKTDMVRNVLHNLEFPTVYSAPASFLAIPVEGVFGALKGKNLMNEEDLDQETMIRLKVKKLTNKQCIIAKVSNYLFQLDQDKITKIFVTRLRMLEHFLLMNPI